MTAPVWIARAETWSWAEISDDQRYRYALGRRWGDGSLLGWIMLNPSTADAETSDQTVNRVVYFSKREGYGGLWVANPFAYRSPSPAALREAATDGHLGHYAIGPANDEWIARMLGEVPAVVLAWGAHGGEKWALPRVRAVHEMARLSGIRMLCLGTTAGGEPRHPCRLGNAVKLEAMS